MLTAISPAQGAALGLREIGAPLNGTASAGWAALGEDANTAATNPAAMTRLKQSEFLVGPQVLVVDIQFDTEQSSFGGGNGGNAGGVLPAGGLFYVHKVNPDLALGFSAGSYLGLGFEFDDDWAGRYFVTKGELVTMAAGPSIGYRLNQQRSIGGSIFALYGELDQRAAINNSVTDHGTPDGEIRFQQDDWDIGGTLGVLYEPTGGTRFGLLARYCYQPQWILSAGVAYDSSPVDAKDRTIDLPLDRQIRLGVGVEYLQRDDLALGCSYGYLNAGDAQLDQTGGPLTGDIKGEFDRNAVHFFNVNARWRF